MLSGDLRIGMFAWGRMYLARGGGIAPLMTNPSEILAGKRDFGMVANATVFETFTYQVSKLNQVRLC